MRRVAQRRPPIEVLAATVTPSHESVVLLHPILSAFQFKYTQDIGKDRVARAVSLAEELAEGRNPP